MTDSDSGPRLLLVGIDAGCFPVVGPLVKAGVTPRLGRLLREGTSAPLESQLPPWTASAWPSLYTGKNPGKHGVFDFVTFDGYDWDVVNASHVRARPIWDLLEEAGHRSVVVNVPVTHPPGEMSGALVPGMPGPESPTCHPPDLLADIEDNCGEYRVYPQEAGQPVRSISRYEQTVESRGVAFRYLCDRFDPDFAFLQFQVTDSVFHEHPGDRRAIEAVYRAVDHELSTTIDAVAPENVLVVSDHGIGPVDGPEFRVNEYLRAAGEVVAQQGGAGMPDWTTAWENDSLDGDAVAGEQRSVLERAVDGAATVGLTTQRVARALDLVGLKEPVGRRLPTGVVRAGSEQVDFRNSRAYVRSKSELGVRINLEGREPEGTVPPEEYETVRDEIADDLAALTTPAGNPVFEAVHPRDAVFHGPYVDQGPDIVTVPRGFDTAISAELADEQFGDPMDPWNHKRTGFVAAAGRDVDITRTIEGATIFDVAPTICSLFDLPIDESMDGRPLSIVEPTEVGTYPSYESAAPQPTADTAIEDRLSDLGYL